MGHKSPVTTQEIRTPLCGESTKGNCCVMKKYKNAKEDESITILSQ
jgi:hypothetical protein